MGCFYFVRHGQTVWNSQHLVCGATDSELTELGYSQAKETGRKIVEQGIVADEILYSPLSRAAETARIISEITGIPRRVEPRLIEQDYGKWEGTCKDDEAFVNAKASFADDWEGGESMMHVAQRVYNLIDDIKASGKTYILVAHNGIVRVVHSYFHSMGNMEYANFSVPNCSVTKYEF